MTGALQGPVHLKHWYRDAALRRSITNLRDRVTFQGKSERRLGKRVLEKEKCSREAHDRASS
jgi:hypothetical protein